MSETLVNLDGYAVLSKKELKEAIREVLAEEGVLGVLRRQREHDRTYKGDEWWLEYRGRVLHLIEKNTIVTLKTLDQDPWFAEQRHVQYIQFDRAVSQHLLTNHPAPDDTEDFVRFTLQGGTKRYLTTRSILHCAIGYIGRCKKDHPPDKPCSRCLIVRITRSKWQAKEPCDRCRPQERVEVNVEQLD